MTLPFMNYRHSYGKHIYNYHSNGGHGVDPLACFPSISNLKAVDLTLYHFNVQVIDGIPTPVEKMTQAQLRAFIPLMLKYSTGRGKPGWGKESTRPPWWPQDLPWANVRMDARTEDEKQKVTASDVIELLYFHKRQLSLSACLSVCTKQ